MLVEYIHAAMQHAQFEQMEDGRCYGTIPPCQGLWADGDNIEQTREALREVLEDWILVKTRFNDPLPVIDGFDINPQPVHAEAD